MRGGHGGWGVLLALALTACGKPQAMGEPTELLVGASATLWEALEDDVLAALEPTTFTVRDEAIFNVAHRDPIADDWREIRLMRQVVLIGSPEDPAVAEAIAAAEVAPPPPPALFQARNVWAANQSVSVILLPSSDAGPAAARPLLGELSTLLVAQLEQYALARMYVSGVNSELADSLRNNAGFTLELPNVYRFEEREPGVFIFRNDQPDPSRLIRNITVASPPALPARPTPEQLGAWRSDLAARHTQPPQITDTITSGNPFDHRGSPALQIEGIWTNPPDEWPAAGIFITRAVDCPTRTFLIDAWLYAPSDPKYEYDFQLRTIVGSFECAGG